MASSNDKTIKRQRRHRRIRSRIIGTAARPRLSVFRSNRFFYAQLINDENGTTLAQANDMALKKGTKVERAQEVGKTLAAAAKKAKIDTVVFDRGGFQYTGRVAAFADAAREAGLQF